METYEELGQLAYEISEIKHARNLRRRRAASAIGRANSEFSLGSKFYVLQDAILELEALSSRATQEGITAEEEEEYVKSIVDLRRKISRLIA